MLSCIQLFATSWTEAFQASLSCTVSQSLLKLMSIELVMPSKHLILYHPLHLMPSLFPSIRIFYWHFSFNISPSNKYSGLISFRIDWFDLLAGQGALKSLLQHSFTKGSKIPPIQLSFLIRLTGPLKLTSGSPFKKRLANFEE